MVGKERDQCELDRAVATIRGAKNANGQSRSLRTDEHRTVLGVVEDLLIQISRR